MFGEIRCSGHGDHGDGGGAVIRFYSLKASDDEALDVLVPRQKFQTVTEAIEPDPAPDPAEISAPG